MTSKEFDLIMNYLKGIDSEIIDIKERIKANERNQELRFTKKYYGQLLSDAMLYKLNYLYKLLKKNDNENLITDAITESEEQIKSNTNNIGDLINRTIELHKEIDGIENLIKRTTKIHKEIKHIEDIIKEQKKYIDMFKEIIR